ncbi:hypothetical protein c7_L121 [Megavirus courdo7]|uniref:Uncharacterized protein n=1 Tax=Megavirus courdo7 TaxID=1128135 RepID=H2E9W4_9VIRU|nr:hypothetical protein c7_L121 [Megavirus courdo7]
MFDKNINNFNIDATLHLGPLIIGMKFVL